MDDKEIKLRCLELAQKTFELKTAKELRIAAEALYNWVVNLPET